MDGGTVSARGWPAATSAGGASATATRGSADFAARFNLAAAGAEAPEAADDAAAAVSAAQGLPAGVYDFTRITPRQLGTVSSALAGAGRIGAHALSAATDLASAASPDEPVNMIAYLNHEAAANEKTPGGMSTAFAQRAALATMTRLHRETDVPISYDDRYPTAPRAMTAEEASAKLKTAIEDFRKEASLTPAQRMAKKLRADVLREMKMTEDDVKAMPDAQRAAVEKKIDEDVARRLALLGFAAADGKTGGEARQDGAAAAGADTGDAKMAAESDTHPA